MGKIIKADGREGELSGTGTIIRTDDYAGWDSDALREFFHASRAMSTELDEALNEDEEESAAEFVAYFYAAARQLNLSPKQSKETCLEIFSFLSPDDDYWAKIAKKSKHLTRDPWNWIGEHLDGADSAQRLKEALRGFPTDESPEPEPAEFDLSGPAREPDWIVRGQIARRRNTMASGDQSASKTTWALGVALAVIRGERILDREARKGRVLYVTGEENTDQIQEEKLKPLGFTNADLEESLEIHTRGTFAPLGTDAGNAWIVGRAEDGDFDLIVLDTTSSVVSTDANSNDAVNALFTDVLDPLVDRTGAALLYLHHERKSGGSGDRSEAARGARAWSDRANFHVTVAAVSKYRETPTGDGESVTTARKFVQRRAKVKGGGVDEPLRYELRGEKDRPDGATLSLALELPRTEYTDAEQIAAACDGDTTRKALAEATGWNATGDRFTKALDAALDEKLIRKVERGVYAPGEATAE